MKTAFITFFTLLGLLQYGILLSAWAAYRSEHKPVSITYWALALAISATSYLSFAAALGTSEELLSKGNSIITVANTLTFAGVLFQGVFARSLRVGISRRSTGVFLALIALYALHFELLRGRMGFEARTISVGIILFIVYLWQIAEIRLVIKTKSSLQLRILLSLVVLEAAFILMRVLVIYRADAGVQTIGQIPPAASMLLWAQLI